MAVPLKMKVTVSKDPNGRLTQLKVLRGKEPTPLIMDFEYGLDGFVRNIEFTGRRGRLPNVRDILDLVNESFIERIATLKTINIIEVLQKLEEISTIKVIEDILSMPDVTVRGNEGVAFKQAAGTGAAWVKPTGNEDPDSEWTNEANAYDSNDATYANHGVLVPQTWTGFIVLTIASVKCSKVRFRACASYYGNCPSTLIDIDVYRDTEWVDVYEGCWTFDADIEKSFSEADITKVRFRIKNNTPYEYYAYVRLFEVSLYKVATAGGEIDVLGNTDETVKGLLRSMGDAGATPLNTSGSTMLRQLSNIKSDLYYILRTLGDAGVSPVNITGYTVLGLLHELLLREDLIPYSEDVAEAGAGDCELIAADGAKQVKVYACGYESEDDVEVCFRFATGTKKWGRRITKGVYAQTFVQPMVSAVNEALNFRVEGAVNAKVWVHYVQE